MRIERKYLRKDEDSCVDWVFYSSHPNWDEARAMQSVERLNKQAPLSWLYRCTADKPPKKRGHCD